VLAFSIDPATADVEAIHGMRKQAKQLRDTLRGYEDVFGPEALRLAEQVSTIQDAAGELHDADVAADRARRFARHHPDLDSAEASAIRIFASRQDERVRRQRMVLTGRLAGLRGGAFRLRVAALVSDGLTGGLAVTSERRG
jgi:CHAD domain-containing protein